MEYLLPFSQADQLTALHKDSIDSKLNFSVASTCLFIILPHWKNVIHQVLKGSLGYSQNSLNLAGPELPLCLLSVGSLLRLLPVLYLSLFPSPQILRFSDFTFGLANTSGEKMVSRVRFNILVFCFTQSVDLTSPCVFSGFLIISNRHIKHLSGLLLVNSELVWNELVHHCHM